MKFFKVFFLIVSLSLYAQEEIRVRSEGQSIAGNMAKAKETALADALRNAIRQGTGTEIASQSQMRNFILEYDQIFTQAFGFVKDYKVISQGYGRDGIYTVKIDATVSQNKSKSSEKQLLQMLMQRKKSPRAVIKANANISGISQQPKISGILQKMALEYQFQIVNETISDEGESRRASRDALLGDRQSQLLRNAKINIPHDFTITANVSGSNNGQENLYGVNMNVYAISADITATKSDTGEIIAQISLPSYTVTSTKSGSAAARDCVYRILNGQIPAAKKQNANNIFRKIISSWIAELDLGKKIILEFKQINKTDFDKLADQLLKIPQVGQIYPRTFDSRLISTLEAETRLDADALQLEVTRILPNFILDRSTRAFLQFIPAPVKKKYPQEQNIKPTTNKTLVNTKNSKQTQASVSTQKRSNLLIWGSLFACIIMLLILCGVLIGKRRK